MYNAVVLQPILAGNLLADIILIPGSNNIVIALLSIVFRGRLRKYFPIVPLWGINDLYSFEVTDILP
jgi:hypothetical protein